MADEVEEKAVEQQLEFQLNEQKASLDAVADALSSDPSNAELLSVHLELVQAIKDAEEGLFQLKRARLLREADYTLQGSLYHDDVSVEPIPTGTEAEPLADNSYYIGSKCRFRHTDGRWYGGLVVGLEGSEHANITFPTPTSESMLVGGIKHSSGEVVDAVSCGSLNLREPNDSSTGHPDINKGISVVVKRFKPRRNQTKNNASDSLSDIDDAEVNRYLNTKEETHYKRMLWEAINGKYVNAKKQKKAAERKKGAPLKKAAKTMEKVKSPKRSSRINYDALKVLNEELEHGSKASQSQIIPADSHTLRSHDTPSPVMHGSDESNETSFDEDHETSGNHSGDLYGQYGNKNYSGDFHDRYGDEHRSDNFLCSIRMKFFGKSSWTGGTIRHTV